MKAEQWAQIQAIVDSALGLPEAERESYVRSACAGDDDLYRRVFELLSESSTQTVGKMFGEGQTIGGRFRIVRFIARGGMGEVYEVYDERLRVRLALKTLRPEYASDREALDRFQREILITREVSHESLCRVYDLIEHQDTLRNRIVPCLTMQLLEGESLRNMLQRHGPMKAEVALPILRQIGGALQVLHENGIIHRDLKPSNIMLTSARDGSTRAVVMDFGLAKAATAEEEMFESRHDTQAGAPYYMAPEVLRGGRPSVASDIYALGLLADEMVTLSKAFPADSMHGLYYQKLWQQAVSPAERSEGLPAHWPIVIMRCLEHDPENRYSSVAEMLGDLQPGVQEAALPVAPLRARVKRTSRRKWLIAAAGVPAAAGVAAVGSFAFRSVNTSVVVFPIENQADANQFDYLCKGTTTELMRRLLQVNGVLVIPFYGPRSTAPQTLKGRFALEGRLQAFQSQVRLTMMLTDTLNGVLVWSQNFDRGMIENPLDLQSEIANGTALAIENQVVFAGAASGIASIAGPIRRMFGYHAAAAAKGPTTSREALDEYMRGRSLLDEFRAPAALAAVQHFEAAIRHDSQFALAYAGIADAQFQLMEYHVAPFQQLLDTARGHAERAVAIGPELPETHTSLAAARQAAWDWPGAEESYRTAIKLNGRFARARRWYSGLIMQFGRFDEGLRETRTALMLDPYDYSTPTTYGLYLFYAGKYDDAIQALERPVRERGLIVARQNLGDVYARLGSLAPGSASYRYFTSAFEQARLVAEAEQRPGFTQPADGAAYSDRMFALYHALAGNMDLAKPYLARLVADMDAGRTSPSVPAKVYAAAGDLNRALDLLERTLATKDRGMLYVKVNPFFERLRTNERFQAILRRMRL